MTKASLWRLGGIPPQRAVQIWLLVNLVLARAYSLNGFGENKGGQDSTNTATIGWRTVAMANYGVKSKRGIGLAMCLMLFLFVSLAVADDKKDKDKDKPSKGSPHETHKVSNSG